MSEWSKEIDIYLDVNRRKEPLLEQVNGVWRRAKMAEWVQGDIMYARIHLMQADQAGVWTEKYGEASDVCSVAGKRRNLSGDPLFTLPNAAQGAEDVFEGVLSLNTEPLHTAMNDYAMTMTRVEITVTNDSGVLVYRWQFDVDVVRSVCDGSPPITPDSDTYYTDAECDARFARKDGPAGYGAKLVTVDGVLMWAQKVGSKWIVNKVIEVGGAYYNTFVEVA